MAIGCITGIGLIWGIIWGTIWGTTSGSVRGAWFFIDLFLFSYFIDEFFLSLPSLKHGQKKFMKLLVGGRWNNVCMRMWVGRRIDCSYACCSGTRGWVAGIPGISPSGRGWVSPGHLKKYIQSISSETFSIQSIRVEGRLSSSFNVLHHRLWLKFGSRDTMFIFPCKTIYQLERHSLSWFPWPSFWFRAIPSARRSRIRSSWPSRKPWISAWW